MATATASRPRQEILAWFAFKITDVSRAAQTFSGEVRPFPQERYLIGKGAFKKTISESGRRVPLLDETDCQIGELTMLRAPSGALRVQGKLWSNIDREFLQILTRSGRIALRIEVIARNGDVVTEVRLISAMFRKNITT